MDVVAVHIPMNVSLVSFSTKDMGIRLLCLASMHFLCPSIIAATTIGTITISVGTMIAIVPSLGSMRSLVIRKYIPRKVIASVLINRAIYVVVFILDA